MMTDYSTFPLRNRIRKSHCARLHQMRHGCEDSASRLQSCLHGTGGVPSAIISCIVPPAPPYSVNISGSSRIGYTNRLSLTCSASGIVDNYKWYHNGNKLTTTTRRYIKSSAQLNDSGSYQCRACNWAGCTSSSSYTVTVIGWFTSIVYMLSTVQLNPYLCMSVCCVYVVCWCRVLL